MEVLKTLKTGLAWDRAIPLMGIYPKVLKLVPQRGISTPVFTGALFTIAKKGKTG